MLYIVGTPIGNLDDLSVRQAKTLASSDIILAEDTRSAQILIQGIRDRFSIQFKSSQKLISYYKEKEFEKLPEVIELLKEGKNISLISESGIPLISDPGYLLTKTVIKQKIPFMVIPGPSAITTSLIHSGFNPKEFMSLGFLPKKESEVLQSFKRLKEIKKIYPEMVCIFFESAKRINATIQLIIKSDWNSDIVICRELTKKFEEIIRGKASELLKKAYKGELTLIVQ